jgi:thiosulfate/3-mercaptopyruvate sulfurtransferase
MHLEDPRWVFVDCRYDLLDTEKGVREYAKGHIPGAFFAHIDRDLSGPVGDGRKGRHPLPIPGAFARWVAAHGIAPGTQVVCYDDVAGQWASRLWWLLRHYGHTDVAVLDGGLTRWKAIKGPLRTQHEKARGVVPFKGVPGSMPTVDLEAVAKAAESGLKLVDARAAERHRGDVEPIDKRAGHIPGAVNVPFAGNVGADMRFLLPEQLKARFAAVGVTEGKGVACHCGSGVTGGHDVLACALPGVVVGVVVPAGWEAHRGGTCEQGLGLHGRGGLKVHGMARTAATGHQRRAKADQLQVDGERNQVDAVALRHREQAKARERSPKDAKHDDLHGAGVLPRVPGLLDVPCPPKPNDLDGHDNREPDEPQASTEHRGEHHPQRHHEGHDDEAVGQRDHLRPAKRAQHA